METPPASPSGLTGGPDASKMRPTVRATTGTRSPPFTSASCVMVENWMDTLILRKLDTLILRKLDTLILRKLDTLILRKLDTLILRKLDTLILRKLDTLILRKLDTLILRKLDTLILRKLDTLILRKLDTLILRKLDTSILTSVSGTTDGTTNTTRSVRLDSKCANGVSISQKEGRSRGPPPLRKERKSHGCPSPWDSSNRSERWTPHGDAPCIAFGTYGWARRL